VRYTGFDGRACITSGWVGGAGGANGHGGSAAKRCGVQVAVGDACE
jgi:hypothetical protein